jgi:hypothetical protein
MDIWAEIIVNLIYVYDPEKIVMSAKCRRYYSVYQRKDRYGWAPFDARSSVFEEAAILSAKYLLIDNDL